MQRVGSYERDEVGVETGFKPEVFNRACLHG
jgi:hypothetical protein